MRILIVGNCQVRPLTEQLKHRFEREHTVDEIIVHLAKDTEETEHSSLMRDADVIFTQPIMDDYPVEHVRSSVIGSEHAGKTLKYPNLFFHGQCPSLCYLSVPGEKRRIRGPLGDYHVFPILAGWLARRPVSELASALKGGAYADDDYDPAKSLAELRTREQDCDIDVTDTIEERWRDEPLFFTFNHPRDSLLVTLADRIFGAADLNLSPFKPFRANSRESLDLIIPPLFPGDIETAGLRLEPRYDVVGQNMHFEDGKMIRCIGRREYEFNELIEAYYQAYDYQEFELKDLAITPANLGLAERLVKLA